MKNFLLPILVLAALLVNACTASSSDPPDSPKPPESGQNSQDKPNDVQVPLDPTATPDYSELEIITLLPKDAISAIDNPSFLAGVEADQQYAPDELVIGVFREETRKRLLAIITSYDEDGVILGCTELPLILNQEDTDVPLLNTLELHAQAALDYALAE